MPDKYRSKYGTARFVSLLVSLAGWLLFLAGLVSVFRMPLLAMLPGIGVAVSGLFLVASGEVMRASVDNADHTREILKVVSQIEVRLGN